MPWLRSKRITVTPALIERSYQAGRAIVDSYAAGFSDASLAVSSHGAEKDPIKQGKAKMAECAFAIYANLDPAAAVKWSGGIDSGSDIALGAALIDVKWTSHGRCLIWPFRKTSFYDSKMFDALVLVKGEPPEFWIQGWISKVQFKEQKTVAAAGDGRFTPGTWYLDQDKLWNMERLMIFFVEKTA